MPVPASDLLRGAPVDAASPWPGPEAFRERDAAFFFGREQVRDALTHEILRHRLVVLYGRSGLGKTSLLRAGVFPRLREAMCLPVYLRLDFAAPGRPARRRSGLRQPGRNRAIEQAAADAHVDVPVPRARGDAMGVVLPHRRRVLERTEPPRATRARVRPVRGSVHDWRQHGRRSARKTAAFLDELIHLIRGSVPPSVAARFEATPGEALAFTTGTRSVPSAAGAAQGVPRRSAAAALPRRR